MTPRLDCTKARLVVKVFIIGSKETRLDNSANEKFQKIGKAIEAVALTDVKADSLASVASGFLKFYNSYPIEARSKITVKLDVERVTLGKKTLVAWYQD